MPQKPGHITWDGRGWFADVAAGQRGVRDTEHDRRELVHRALTRVRGVRGFAGAQKIDRTTVGRRCRKAAR